MRLHIATHGRKWEKVLNQLRSHYRRLARLGGADQAKPYNDHLVRDLISINGVAGGISHSTSKTLSVDRYVLNLNEFYIVNLL